MQDLLTGEVRVNHLIEETLRMYQRLDEEHYVENPFLAQLLGLGWEVYKQNSGDPQDLRKLNLLARPLIPYMANARIYGKASGI